MLPLNTPGTTSMLGATNGARSTILIKMTSKPGLTYQDNLKNEIASLLTINGSLPESQYFPVIREHGKLRDGRVYIIASFFHEFPLATAIGQEPIPGKTVAYIRTAMETARALRELHRLKIYHVDVNPMNILLRLAHGGQSSGLSTLNLLMSGPGIPPEFSITPEHSGILCAGDIPPAARCPFGCFSLGAVLYTMLAGYKWTWDADVESACTTIGISIRTQGDASYGRRCKSRQPLSVHGGFPCESRGLSGNDMAGENG